MSAGHVEVADRLFAAVVAGDARALRAAYAPDATLWSNVSGTTMRVEEIVQLVRDVVGSIRDYRYEDIVCEATPSGFVREHLVTGQTTAGEPFAVPACCVGQVVDGRVLRLAEYIDGTASVVIAS